MPRKQPALAAAAALLVLSAAAAAAFAYHAVWMRRLARMGDPDRDSPYNFTDRLPPGFTRELLNSLGSAGGDRASRFHRFPEAKPPGTLRIGAFGDSFTFGDEVGDNEDFPSQLAALLRTRGLRSVEVLNFGNSWHGFHQAYRLWEWAAPRYGIDVVLLGPGGFQTDRDASFNHAGPGQPYYLHGRYVLNAGGDGFSFVDLPDDGSFKARFRRHFKAVPDRRTLRYDAWAPGLLKSLFAPASGRLANPFYYRSDAVEDEMHRLYALMLKSMADRSRLVILLHRSDPRLVSIAKRLGPKIVAAAVPTLEHFPYWSADHHNANGNAFTARIFFDAFAGKPVARSKLLVTEPLPPAPGGAAEPGPAAVVRAELRSAGRTVARLAAVPSEEPKKRREDFEARSLLIVRDPSRSASDSTVALLGVDLVDGQRAELRGLGGSRPLGIIRAQTPGARLFQLALPGARKDGSLYSEFLHATSIGRDSPLWGYFEDERPETLDIGGVPVFALRRFGNGPEAVWGLIPRGGQAAAFHPEPGFPSAATPAHGTLEAVLYDSRGGKAAFPLDRYQTNEVRIPLQ